MNLWLFVAIQAVCSVVIGFTGIVIVLSLGWISASAIIWCFVISGIMSLPPAWLITKRLTQGDR